MIWYKRMFSNLGLLTPNASSLPTPPFHFHLPPPLPPPPLPPPFAPRGSSPRAGRPSFKPYKEAGRRGRGRGRGGRGKAAGAVSTSPPSPGLRPFK